MGYEGDTLGACDERAPVALVSPLCVALDVGCTFLTFVTWASPFLGELKVPWCPNTESVGPFRYYG